MKHKVLLQLLFLTSTLAFVGTPAFAHNVIGGVYVIGADVEGEIGFSNGKMAPAGTKVIVNDAFGNELISIETDEEGFFTFTAKKRIDHHFFADLGSGHVFETVLKVEELPDTLPSAHGKPLSSGQVLKSSHQDLIDEALSRADLQNIIEKAVAKQIKPLRQELNAYKEKATFRDAIGGIGYIFGLCGVGIWLNNRKQNALKEKQQETSKVG